MLKLLILIHCFISFLIVVISLFQQCKNFNGSSSLVSGFSHTVFGSKSYAPFIFKFTILLIIFFFLTSLSLNYITKKYSIVVSDNTNQTTNSALISSGNE